ncbi:sulfotransferase 1A1-like [Glandiceps talaboti]
MVDAETIANSGFCFSIDKIRNFEVRSDDIFILTFSKSGTTWLKAIIPLVLNGGDTQALKDVPLDIKVPYLEFALSADSNMKCREIQRGLCMPEGFDVTKIPSPRIFNSHLRQEFLPTQIESKKPKIIYCARNPKDVAVSLYWFNQTMLQQHEEGPFPGDQYNDFNNFLPDYIEFKGRTHAVNYDGSKWHKHVLTWWNRRHDDNVLFLKYEDMIRDLKTSVLDIAQFLNVQLSDEAAGRIAEHCSFGSMKKNKLAVRSNFCTSMLNVVPEEQSPFVRKGGVGGWKTYFTVAQSEHFDSVYRDWLKDSDLKMEFELTQ